jgi:hypothetical protein
MAAAMTYVPAFDLLAVVVRAGAPFRADASVSPLTSPVTEYVKDGIAFPKSIEKLFALTVSRALFTVSVAALK